MTLYDAAMAALVLGGMVWGAWKGIIWQLASLLSLALGYTVAHTVSDDLAIHFPGDPLVARGLAMIIIYACVSGGVFFGAWLIRETLRKIRFESYDRHLGMILGGFEGALLGLVATVFLVSLAPQSRESVFASPSGKMVGAIFSKLGPVLPTEVRDVLKPFWDNEQNPISTQRNVVSDEVESLPETRTSEAYVRSSTTHRR